MISRYIPSKLEAMNKKGTLRPRVRNATHVAASAHGKSRMMGQVIVKLKMKTKCTASGTNMNPVEFDHDRKLTDVVLG